MGVIRLDFDIHQRKKPQKCGLEDAFLPAATTLRQLKDFNTMSTIHFNKTGHC